MRIVYFRAIPEEEAESRADADFIASLSALFPRVVVMDSLYDLPEGDPRGLSLTETSEDLLLLGRFAPRALIWTTVRRGALNGRRRLYALDVRRFTPATLAAAATEKAAVEGQAGAPAKTSGDAKENIPPFAPPEASVVASPTPPVRRWYPVVDYDRCTTCMSCLDYCLFGVYGADTQGRLRVTQPDMCRPNCPACARVCPRGAIIFPRCREDARIAGEETSGAVEIGDARAPNAVNQPERLSETLDDLKI